jgi:hypothetical protein
MSEKLADAFRDPPREFGFMPFWFWNGLHLPLGLMGPVRLLRAKAQTA